MQPTMPYLLLFIVVSLLIATVRLFSVRRPTAPSRMPPRTGNQGASADNVGGRIQPKPPWVREEIIRLKALMPNHGCRKIAVTFNLLHLSRREMSVGKSFVADVVRASKAEIQLRRRELKHRVPRAIPKNTIWALDLTTVEGHPVLGVVDHGTRACLELSKVRDKTMMTILRSIIGLIERLGRPKVLRTDNEGMFASPFFGLVLKMLGVRHQRTLPQAPWQNGRIERFFGTLKAALRLRTGGSIDQADLRVFRAWYNHARPHQHLDGRTPAEAWNPAAPQPMKSPRFFSAWDGVLTGFVR